MGAGKYGGFGKTRGTSYMRVSPPNSITMPLHPKGNSVKLPKDKSQLKHIFANRPGHLTDTPYHRKQLKDLANTPFYHKGTDKYGNSWNVKVMQDGSQLWVIHRDGVIQNGGKNAVPIKWDNETGLNNNPFKKKGGSSR